MRTPLVAILTLTLVAGSGVGVVAQPPDPAGNAVAAVVLGPVAGADTGALPQEIPGSTIAQLPVAGYWGEWDEHKQIYRARAARGLANARRANAKVRFYQRLVGIHADELAWLKNHQPDPCYADEYQKWRRAVKNLHTIHRNTVRFLRAGKTAGVRRAARAEKAGIKRLNKAKATISACGPTPPRAAPPQNPFLGAWKGFDIGVQKDGFVGAGPWSVRFTDDGYLLRRSKSGFCRTLGHGYVPLTIQGSTEYVTDDGPKLRTDGRMYCHPRRGGRRLIGQPSGEWWYHPSHDVVLAGGGCAWRKGPGSAKDCRAFYRGEPAPRYL